ncbi:MAG: hypothetical protein EPO22_11670 [Dehalococcoidia bacterium]|nr:MAG: hypothetical protein EPO22_11670 [Dehalococcoidia bacterium]
MTAADARVARLAIEAAAAELPTEREPEAEPSAVREAVATIEAPEPTSFVSREWDETADAVENTYRPPEVALSRPAEQSDPGRTAALVGAVLGFGLLLIVMRRRST